MRRTVAARAAILAAVTLASAPAAGAADGPAQCGYVGESQTCDVQVSDPGKAPSPGSGETGPGKRPGTEGAQQPVWNPCITILVQPQPPKSDPVWGGHTTGAIYARGCQNSVGTPAQLFWAPGPPAAPAVTGAQVAQKALATVHLPKPTPSFSPGHQAADGILTTYVNAWTWYWTPPQTYQTLTATAQLGGLAATVTVRPQELSFAPGDGHGTVTCPGPGRPWTPADSSRAPSGGACGYRYQQSTALVRPQLTIRWTVTWTATDGATGTLPDLNTTAASAFRIEQVQSVNR